MSRSMLILGASSNLARAVVRKEISNYDMFLLQYCNSYTVIEQLKEEFGEKIVPIQANFSDEASTDEFVNTIKAYKDIESLLHLAANKIRYSKIHKTSWDVVENDMNIQLRSIWKTVSAVLPGMMKRKTGKIVMVLSSCTVNTPPRFLAGYTTCKYALLGFMKSLAVECAEKGVLVNAVSPGMMDTKFLEFVPEFVKEDTVNKNPMKRLANENDVLPVIEMLLSDENTYMSGQNIVISGGE